LCFDTLNASETAFAVTTVGRRTASSSGLLTEELEIRHLDTTLAAIDSCLSVADNYFRTSRRPN
jgi:hypothetical protein